VPYRRVRPRGCWSPVPYSLYRECIKNLGFVFDTCIRRRALCLQSRRLTKIWKHCNSRAVKLESESATVRLRIALAFSDVITLDGTELTRRVTFDATSITAFLSRASHGPIDEDEESPVIVNSFADLERTFAPACGKSSLGRRGTRLLSKRWSPSRHRPHR
jgi:hypothetical protein